ncbi:MAG TPA: type II CAAX endopeptidase family protein [Terriglobales bacterium]|nr:type II CAAX endopeptidase family protein [Terriglobales bacterium]
MLPEKSWKPEAILRFFMSVVVCFFAGSFLIAALQFGRGLSTASAFRFYALLGSSLVFLCITMGLLRRSWILEDNILRVAAILACFYAGLTLGAFAARNAGVIRPSVAQMIISALSLQGAVLVLLTPFLRVHGLSWSEAFGLKNHTIRAVLAGLAVGAAFLPLAWLLQAFSAQMMTWVHVKPVQQQAVQTLQLDNASLGRAIFGAISIVLVPPAEESFFRGILYTWIRSAGYPTVALWGTSLLFAAIHANLMSFIPLAAFALALAMLYEKTNNLLAPISAHALFNAANLLRLYLIERSLT